jgi:glycosyltransferase-like protein
MSNTSSVSSPRIALITYSTKPRGGVVHTLALGEAMYAAGAEVTIVTLGDPEVGFYRDVAAPTLVFPAPSDRATLEEKVFASIDALETGLRSASGRFDILHTQDCISARAAVRIREAGAPVRVLRTVHHVDDFTTQALIDCQIKAIHEPDQVFVVSDHWRRLLAADYGVDADVVWNGVDYDLFATASEGQASQLRQRTGVPPDRFLFLAVGGLEPRKGSIFLVRALAELKSRMSNPPAVAVLGGHSFQDYEAYRNNCLHELDERGLKLGDDVVILGTVPAEELVGWYHACDALAYPSTNEGWGLAVLEALAAGRPAVTSDIDVFGEYLVDGVSALMPPVGDHLALADALERVATDADVRARLIAGGRPVAEKYSWSGSATRHLELYAATPSPNPAG